MAAVAHLTLDLLRAAAREVAEAYALDLVVLFGSAAREGFAAAGDVDLGVRAARPVDDWLQLYEAFVGRLGTAAVDVVDLRRASPTLQVKAAEDAVVLYERTPGEFAAFATLAGRRFDDARKFRDAEREYVRDYLRERGLLAEPAA